MADTLPESLDRILRHWILAGTVLAVPMALVLISILGAYLIVEAASLPPGRSPVPPPISCLSGDDR